MFKNLNLGAIGIKATLGESIDYARRYGFIGIDFSITEAVTLAETIGMDGVRDLFENAGVFPGSWGFPVNYRQDDAAWREGLMMLPKQAEFALELGCTRTATWILPARKLKLELAKAFCIMPMTIRPGATKVGKFTPRIRTSARPIATLKITRNSSVVIAGAQIVWVCTLIKRRTSFI